MDPSSSTCVTPGLQGSTSNVSFVDSELRSVKVPLFRGLACDDELTIVDLCLSFFLNVYTHELVYSGLVYNKHSVALFIC